MLFSIDARGDEGGELRPAIDMRTRISASTAASFLDSRLRIEWLEKSRYVGGRL
jgi:hypothetical protein